MNILQLGNGGGLNPLLTNSSFLIDLHGDKSSYLLFDCGFNVMARLLELESQDKDFQISNIDYIFLSHLHDDHVGNYETLIYWNFFKNNKKMTTLAASEEVHQYIGNKSSFILETGKLKNIGIFESYSANGYSNIDNISLISTECDHGPSVSNGLIILHNEKYSKEHTMIFISGDTKALPAIENKINSLIKNYKVEKSIYFHDFSNWNAPTRNVHACEGDFTVEYSKEFQDKCIKYHTAENFDKEWQTIALIAPIKNH